MQKKDVDYLEGVLATDIAMRICANHDIEATLNKHYTKAKQLCQDFEFTREAPVERAIEIGCRMAALVADHYGGIDEARAIVNKDRVVHEDSSTMSICVDVMSDFSSQFLSDVLVAHSRFLYGDFGDLSEDDKRRNAAALRGDGGEIVGLYDTCLDPIYIVNKHESYDDDGTETFGALTTIMFYKERR